MKAKLLFLNPAEARFTFSASIFRRSANQLQPQTEELTSSGKKSF